MPLITSRLRLGFTPRRFSGTSRSRTAHCRSFSQNSLAIGQLPSNRELESDPPEPEQADLIGFGA
jgi:hypothetical protein